MNVASKSLSMRLGMVAAGVIAVATLAGPASAASPTDAWITTKAKVALLTNEGVSATAVNVDTVNRRVTLHGAVASTEEKQKAEEAVRSIDGVTSVRNLLQVAAPGHEKTAARSDEQIAADVRSALQRQSSLDDSTITVASVNKGAVLLKGDAANMTDRLTAVQTARRVPGVVRVSSEIQGPDTLADSKIWKDSATDREAPAKDRGIAETAGDAAKSTGHAIGSTARAAGNAIGDATRSTVDAAGDMYTTSMVKMRLLADEQTPALDINVDTRDGDVTLFGMVPTAQAKAQAEAEARKVASVRKVKNELQVVAEAKQDAVKATDQEVAANVKEKLRENADLKDVTIDVKNCVVRLTGRVPSGEQRLEAMQVARATRGVCAVHDDLSFQ